MKSPTFVAESVAVLCGKCGEPIVEPETGSQFWTLEELNRERGRDLSCVCGNVATLVVPARVVLA